MTPIEAAWNLLKANPQHEVVQNRYRFTRQGHPFLDEKGNPTNNTKRDLVEQMRLGTLHPAIHPAKIPLIESVSGRRTNLVEGSHLTPIRPSDILRYPNGFNVTGAESGRADAERVQQQRQSELEQRRLTGNTFPPRLIDKHSRAMGGLSDEEFENLRQQAQQMPFSYEGQ